MSRWPGRVALRVWASPHPGDTAFVGAVAAAVPDHAHYRSPNDIVPKVPLALGYEHLPNTISVGPTTDKVEIKSDWGCSHHLLSYISLLAPELYQSIASAQDQPDLSCVIPLS